MSPTSTPVGRQRRWSAHLCGVVLALLLLTHLPAPSSSSPAPETPSANSFTDSSADLEVSESQQSEFISLNELQKLDIGRLLEINFINRTVAHYQSKFERVQSSLDSRVKDLLDDLKGNHRSRFTPELQSALNSSLVGLLRELQLSPFCLNALNHLRTEMLNKRPWPLKCKYY